MTSMLRYKWQLTVGQLKQLLKDVPNDWLVSTEGCDCVGPSDGVSIEVEERVVIIERNDSLQDEEA